MKHWRDKSGEIQRYVDYWLKKDSRFEHLKGSGILSVFRSEHATNRKEDLPIAGQAMKISNKNRDLFGYDFMLVIAHDIWRELGRKQRARLVWHELYHCVYAYDDNGDPLLDKDGRKVLSLEPHDLYVATFQEEVELFGLSAEQLPVAKFFYEAYKKHVKKNKQS